jgi:hypothetical protein
MLATSPNKVDQDARVLREAFEWLVLGDDDRAIAAAARALFWFCKQNPEYALCRMWPPADAVEAKPVDTDGPKRIESKFDGACKLCRKLVIAGDECFWTPGEKGVTCLKCGGSR